MSMRQASPNDSTLKATRHDRPAADRPACCRPVTTAICGHRALSLPVRSLDARSGSDHGAHGKRVRDDRPRDLAPDDTFLGLPVRSEEHTSELQSLMRISYAGLSLQKKQ